MTTSGPRQSFDSLVVAMATYRRPADLASALPAVLAQLDEVSAGPSAPDVSVLVVDNDAAASGRDTVARIGDDRIRYVVEPKPGIASARNRALAESAEQDLLVFIDDDELPQAGWLAALLQTWSSSDAAGVAGAVVSEFAGELEPWVAAGDFFRRRRLPTGTEITVAATNNLLLDLRVIGRLGLQFDQRFGATGGSDTLFTRALVAAGERMLWCNEAIVVDRVPAARMTRRWVLLRALRSGNAGSRTSLALAESGGHRVALRFKLAGRGVPRLLAGAARYVLGVCVRNLAHEAKGLRTAARGAGMISGAFGYTYAEYKRTAPVDEAMPVIS